MASDSTRFLYGLLLLLMISWAASGSPEDFIYGDELDLFPTLFTAAPNIPDIHNLALLPKRPVCDAHKSPKYSDRTCLGAIAKKPRPCLMYQRLLWRFTHFMRLPIKGTKNIQFLVVFEDVEHC